MHCTGYQVIGEWLEHPELGTVRTYGLQLTQTGEIIHDVSTDRAFVTVMALLFDHCCLEAVHFHDVVTDFVSCPEALWEAAARAKLEIA